MRPLSKGLVLLLLALVIIRAPQAMEEVHSSVSQGDARLAAFKNNLMEIALARGAVVKGLSYIDDQGALHENTLFTVNQPVSGAQIEAYIEEMGGQALSEWGPIDIRDACGIWGGVNERSFSKTVFSKVSSSAGDQSSAQRFITPVAGALLDELRERLPRSGLKLANSKGLRARPPPSRSSYQKMVMGGAPDLQADYLLELEVGIPSGPKDRAFYQRWYAQLTENVSDLVKFEKSGSQRVSYQVVVSLTEAATSQVLVRYVTEIKTSVRASYKSGDLSVDMRPSQVLKDFIVELDAVLSNKRCTPKFFTVSRIADSNNYLVGGGFDRDIRVGDWLLVGDTSLMINGQLSNAVLDGLFIVKVAQVAGDSAVGERLGLGPSDQLSDSSAMLATIL